MNENEEKDGYTVPLSRQMIEDMTLEKFTRDLFSKYIRDKKNEDFERALLLGYNEDDNRN
jgi:hypothetical protein